jgi:hypothetical protein
MLLVVVLEEVVVLSVVWARVVGIPRWFRYGCCSSADGEKACW